MIACYSISSNPALDDGFVDFNPRSFFSGVRLLQSAGRNRAVTLWFSNSENDTSRDFVKSCSKTGLSKSSKAGLAAREGRACQPQLHAVVLPVGGSAYSRSVC